MATLKESVGVFPKFPGGNDPLLRTIGSIFLVAARDRFIQSLVGVPILPVYVPHKSDGHFRLTQERFIEFLRDLRTVVLKFDPLRT